MLRREKSERPAFRSADRDLLKKIIVALNFCFGGW
jgi:hypothetical protein